MLNLQDTLTRSITGLDDRAILAGLPARNFEDNRYETILSAIFAHLVNDRLYASLRVNGLFNEVALHHTDPTANDNRAIRWAAREGRVEEVKRLLQDDRISPGARDNEAFISACRNGHVKVLKHLLRWNERMKENASFQRAIAVVEARDIKRDEAEVKRLI